jgi:hypothetical protein
MLCCLARRSQARCLPGTLLDRSPITPRYANSITAHGTSRGGNNFAEHATWIDAGVIGDDSGHQQFVKLL